MGVSVHEATTQLSRLIGDVEAGLEAGRRRFRTGPAQSMV